MKQTLRTYLKWFLPVLFVTYYGFITLFMHTHIENGVTIVHSHPFQNQANGTSHHHTLSEIQFFNALSHINIADGAVHSLDVHLYFAPFQSLITQPVCPGYISQFSCSTLLRAPPLRG